MSWIPNSAVEQILNWLPYQVDANGVLVTRLDSDGRITDPEPLIGDYGDVLPFFLKLRRSMTCFLRASVKLAFMESVLAPRRFFHCARSAFTSLMNSHLPGK